MRTIEEVREQLKEDIELVRTTLEAYKGKVIQKAMENEKTREINDMIVGRANQTINTLLQGTYLEGILYMENLDIFFNEERIDEIAVKLYMKQFKEV